MPRLTVQSVRADTGAPSGDILTYADLPAATPPEGPPIMPVPALVDVTMAVPLPVTAGQRLAIVSQQQGQDRFNWWGNEDYATGTHWYVNDGSGNWRFNTVQGALMYKVYVEPAMPATAQDCRDGGWRHLVDSKGQAFRNQGACITFVTRTA